MDRRFALHVGATGERVPREARDGGIELGVVAEPDGEDRRIDVGPRGGAARRRPARPRLFTQAAVVDPAGGALDLAWTAGRWLTVGD